MADKGGHQTGEHPTVIHDDCDPNSVNAGTSETQQLINTLYINIVVFVILLLFFEINRHMKSVYLFRMTKEKLVNGGRVPPVQPPSYLFGWIVALGRITEDEILQMVGLDGYMLMRYINICFRICAFLTFWGLAVLVPVYGSSSGKNCGWSKFTLANVPNDYKATELWAPTILAYIFAAYFCQVMHAEYLNFLEKRVQYLIVGDPSTPLQAYYTVMVERIPGSLRSVPKLRAFFENLFPDDVYHVELASDLGVLDALISDRRTVRGKLEKAIANWKATDIRPTVLLSEDLYASSPEPLLPVKFRGWDIGAIRSSLRTLLTGACGLVDIDAIEHYSCVLAALNETVLVKQSKYFSAEGDDEAIDTGNGKYNSVSTAGIGISTGNAIASAMSMQEQNKASLLAVDIRYASEQRTKTARPSLVKSSVSQPGTAAITNTTQGTTQVVKAKQIPAPRKSNSTSLPSVVTTGRTVTPVEGLAKESMKTAELAAKGAVRGVLEAARTLELLTVGAYYATSSTAFVTFKSRTASSTCHQMLLSHKYISMLVRPAPNPKDIIWENVSIPQRQIDMRKNIADGTLIVGALFWSIVLGFITTISSLESLSREYTWLRAYSGTEVYKFVNSYLASSVLLTLLTLLPVVFDIIARNYESLKLESEVQNSIMTRYFYYQLANVFVSVYAGSIVTALHQILDSPSNIFNILGATIPSFSVYFANLIIVKTFTAIPLELLRTWPLIQTLSLKLCLDKKRCTWRELREGAFSDPPLLYGWIYPSLMMVLMIAITYACISPLLCPIALLYYSLVYLMYKYQLLYVYVNAYQAGGYMWYALFTRSMVALICGIVTLICYLGIRKTYFSGPFYVLIPLPFLIALFWYYCETKFRGTSMALSLESAVELDREMNENGDRPDGRRGFARKLYRQPSLAEGPLRPAPYRKSNGGSVWSAFLYQPKGNHLGLDGHTISGKSSHETGHADERGAHRHMGLTVEVDALGRVLGPTKKSHEAHLGDSFASDEFEAEDSDCEAEMFTHMHALLDMPLSDSVSDEFDASGGPIGLELSPMSTRRALTAGSGESAGRAFSNIATSIGQAVGNALSPNSRGHGNHIVDMHGASIEIGNSNVLPQLERSPMLSNKGSTTAWYGGQNA